MTVSVTNYWEFTLTVLNMADKTKYSKVHRDINVSSDQLAMKLLDSSSVAFYVADKFLVVEISDLSIRQRIVFSEFPKQ